jgi:hypothetical protein
VADHGGFSSPILDQGRAYPGKDNDVYQRRKTRLDDPLRTFTGTLDLCGAN